MGSQLFDATSSLMASDLSAKEFEFEQKKKMNFIILYILGLGVADTISQSFQDKKRITKQYKIF